MDSNHWLAAGAALLVVCVFAARFAIRRSRRFDPKAPMTKRNFDLGYHLVALLDVQGQREKFRQLRLPKTPEESAVVGEVLRQTAGFVLDLREAFDEQFESFEAGAANMMKRHPGQPVRPKFVGFSDSFVASVSLRNDGGDLLPIVRVSMANCYFATPHRMKHCYIPFFMLLISNALLVLARHRGRYISLSRGRYLSGFGGVPFPPARNKSHPWSFVGVCPLPLTSMTAFCGCFGGLGMSTKDFRGSRQARLLNRLAGL